MEAYAVMKRRPEETDEAIYICECETTAERLMEEGNSRLRDTTIAEGYYVTDVTLEWRGTQIYGPVTVIPPSRMDKLKEDKKARRLEAVQKARSLGLTPEDIAAIRGE